MICKPAFLALCLACAATHPAMASSSDHHEMEGGSLRLVTSGLAGEDGVLRGALVIELDPGWKTYWRDPGASGVPPQIDVSKSLNVAAAELHFPVPGWHEDSYGDWAGYDGSVVLPVSFRIEKPDRFSVVEASLFLGVCEAICVPVQADLTVEPGSDPDNPQDASIVEAAFASLPGAVAANFGITDAELSKGSLTIEAAVPDPSEVELFIAGNEGYMFGRPDLAPSDDGGVAFIVPVLVQPASGTAKLPYTLLSGGRAVSGELLLP